MLGQTPLKDEGRQKWGRGVIEMLSNSQNDKACTLGNDFFNFSTQNFC